MQIQNTIQERVKRQQEHQELYWFTLPQELHPVSLSTSKEIHLRTKKFKQHNHNQLFHPTRATPYSCKDGYPEYRTLCTPISINPIHLQKNNSQNQCFYQN